MKVVKTPGKDEGVQKILMHPGPFLEIPGPAEEALFPFLEDP